MDLLKKDKDQILERIISKIIIFFVSFLVRSLLKSSGCKRFCNHFLFIGSSGYVYLSFFSVIEVRFILLKSRIIWGLNEPKAKTKMASSRSESRVQLFWEKHHLNLLKILTDIILALDKIKTIINIVLYQYRCTVTKKKICFGKAQAVVKYFSEQVQMVAWKKNESILCMRVYTYTIFLFYQMERNHS